MALPDVPLKAIDKHYEGDPSDFTDDYLQGRLDSVVDKIENRWGSIVEARLSSGKLKERTYEEIVVRVAARVFRNPEGFKSEKEGQYDYEVSAAVASGTIWFTTDDERDLTGIDPNAQNIPRTAGLSPRWAW
ncbi:MAG: hypothetical protein ACTH4Y_08055 [Microbacterium gubbeenense]|uniref:hypothetical protein n=1 Tax=Microbacterium gubbeenense TaxID=159896 RepID=UPI003F94A125